MFRGIDPIQILLSLPAVFLAMSFHEFAHALVAYRMGDDTPRKQGRLTLDPLVHIDWMGLIMFAVFGFGWAKPVQVNPSNFKNKQYGGILVSLAGPAANIILAMLSTILYFILVNLLPDPRSVLMNIVYFMIYLNIVFALLNLIPIPPFDGYHVVKDLFFKRHAQFFWKYEQYSMYILLAFILFGVFGYLVTVPSHMILNLFFRMGMSISALF